MHFQRSPQNWPDVLPHLPPRALLKSFDASLLREAKQLRPDVITDFRHHDFYYPFDRAYSFDELKAIWRANFWRFVDGTYLAQYAPHVDLVEELNEYTDSRMVTDKALLAPYLASARAAVAVWNAEFRGRTVTNPNDGGQGAIPADCRLVICNSPVGNDVPREFYELAVVSDSVLGVHPYTRYWRGVRDAQDWRYHSGRWAFNEAEYGIKPVYAFTETGPYAGSADGWRHPDVLNGDVPALAEAMRAWIADVVQTAAYREGRILGPGAWFTSGHVGWEFYQMDTPELIAVADAIRPLWVASAPILIADFSMYQARYIGPANGNRYDPMNWVVDIDWAALERSEIGGIIIRVGIGLRKDPIFDRLLAGLLSSRFRDAWGIYHVYDPGLAGQAQADAARGWCAATPPLGVWGDLEMGEAADGPTDIYLRALDSAFHRLTGLYSGGPYMNEHFSLAQQIAWRLRLAWWAGYPNFITPAGWVGQALTYTLHQFTSSYMLAGVPRRCDMSRINPTLTLSDLMRRDVPMTEEELQAIHTHAAAIDAIAQKYLAPPPAPVPLFRVKVVATSLNIRSTPGVITTATDVGDAFKDQILDVWEVVRPAGYTYDWYRIDPAQQRWVAGGSFVVRV